jgi:hypothetical protein
MTATVTVMIAERAAVASMKTGAVRPKVWMPVAGMRTTGSAAGKMHEMN